MILRENYHKVPNKVPNKLLEAFPEITEGTWEVFVNIKANPHVTIAKLAALLSMSDRMVKRHMALLKERGLVVRVGSNKTGYWKTDK